VTSVFPIVLSVRPMAPLAWTMVGRRLASLLGHLRLLLPEVRATSFEPDGFSTPRPFMSDQLWSGR
jgi:hypothetical protein